MHPTCTDQSACIPRLNKEPHYVLLSPFFQIKCSSHPTSSSFYFNCSSIYQLPVSALRIKMPPLRAGRAILRDLVLCSVRSFLSSTPCYSSLSIQSVFDIIARGIGKRVATRGQLGCVFYELIDNGKIPQLKSIRDQAARIKRKTKRDGRRRWRKMCENERLEGDILTLNLALENAGVPKSVM